MSRARRARRIAVRAAYGGGTVGLAGAAVAGLLLGQARLARRAVGEPEQAPLRADGMYGGEPDASRLPLVVAMLGDSSAAGLGVARPQETPAALIAAGLAEVAGQPVRLVNVAFVGARSSDLDAQVEAVLQHAPRLAVLMIGANDVIHRVRQSIAIRQLEQAVRRLLDAGVQVVVGTCPDLGTVEPIALPLRWLARRWSRGLAAAQTIAVVEAGGRTVSLGDLLGPEFAARPGEMFSADRFHPSAIGYASAAAALLPSACAALDLWPVGQTEEQPSPARGEGVRALAQAAVEAVDEPGTEVAPTRVAGRDRGPRGRWVTLRHRIRRFTRRPATAREAVDDQPELLADPSGPGDAGMTGRMQ